MDSPDTLLANIADLEAEMLRGERGVKFADREVTYRSPTEIQAQIDYFQRKLARLRNRPRQFLMRGERGL